MNPSLTNTVNPVTQTVKYIFRWPLWLAAVVLVLSWAGPALAQENGYTYTVQVGDNWTVVAKRVGLSVE